jgi:hypothetical protein
LELGGKFQKRIWLGADTSARIQPEFFDRAI